MVGQRFVTLLADHPWFELVVVAASPKSAGKVYEDAVKNRWCINEPIPHGVKELVVKSVEDDVDAIVKEVDLVFSAIDMDKDSIRTVEELYASKDCAVVSNNSAHRWTDDVPMIIPEVNPDHVKLIDTQRKNRGWKKGLIAVKPNCSLQSYVPILKALEQFEVKEVLVTTLQALSGAGKTHETWPEMQDNVLPYIQNEEEKSEKEPMKILGKIDGKGLHVAKNPNISVTCIRVPVSDGHMTSVELSLSKKVSADKIIDALENFENPLNGLDLPSAPEQFIQYHKDEDRPQTKLDRDYANGMGLSVGRLRESSLGWKFVSLSHNTIRGAAGGAILVAELLVKKDYI